MLKFNYFINRNKYAVLLILIFGVLCATENEKIVCSYEYRKNTI